MKDFISHEELESTQQEIVKLLAEKEYVSGKAIFILKKTIEHIENYSTLSL